MGHYAHADNTSDFAKLQQALSDVVKMFSSTDAMLGAIGLSNMPIAQQYGILFGCCVFIFTLASVVTLLVLGGTFKRIAKEGIDEDGSLISAAGARRIRNTLLETLLQARERLLQGYTSERDGCLPEEDDAATTDTSRLVLSSTPSPLMTMLLNVAPPSKPSTLVAKDENEANASSKVAEDDVVCVRNESNDSAESNSKDCDNLKTCSSITSCNSNISDVESYCDRLYTLNYIEAYSRCRDKPGGKVLPGRPDARFEAYARAYAGCGPHCSKAYRRSYGRMYESIACMNHAVNDKYNSLHNERPYDIIGKHVRLEGLDIDRHVVDLYHALSGRGEETSTPSYDPNEVWGFQVEGPFESPDHMSKSFLFQRKVNEAGFAIVHNITDRIMGAIMLVCDDPKNLSIQLEPPILPPNKEGSQHQLEACFLLIDRLFGYGYRRIQVSIDAQDSVEKRKLCTRLGCTLEGVLFHHMIHKEASRDSTIYSIVNSDWYKGGARGALFKKLYGLSAHSADIANERSEAEFDEKQQHIRQQQQQESTKLIHGSSHPTSVQ